MGPIASCTPFGSAHGLPLLDISVKILRVLAEKLLPDAAS